MVLLWEMTHQHRMFCLSCIEQKHCTFPKISPMVLLEYFGFAFILNNEIQKKNASAVNAFLETLLSGKKTDL